MQKQLITGDCETWLATGQQVQCLIADPPDNLGLGYDEYRDRRPDYHDWLERVMRLGVSVADHSFWLVYWKHQAEMTWRLWPWIRDQGLGFRVYYWHFTFGQAAQGDCTPSYRPVIRISRAGAVLPCSCRVPSDRSTIYGDPRASARGKMPDDVWTFARVTGNHPDRCSWHPTQVPVGVYTRIIGLATNAGDSVVDLFAGTGTLFRAARELPDRRYIGIELSSNYCAEIRKLNPNP